MEPPLSPLQELRAFGLTFDITDEQANQITAALLIIDGQYKRGEYDLPLEPRVMLMGTVYERPKPKKHIFDAYDAIARVIVSKQTPHTVLTEQIPSVVYSYHLHANWQPRMKTLEHMQGFLIGPTRQWLGIQRQGKDAPAPQPEVRRGSTDERRSENRKAVIMPLLDEREMTRSQWATKAGVDPSVVYDYIEGKSNPRPHNRKALADALGINLQQLPR
jgi:hypothetical protein